MSEFAVLGGLAVLAVPIYLAIAYHSMYHYALKTYPTKVFPPGNKLIATQGKLCSA
jgi:hypothetical protein